MWVAIYKTTLFMHNVRIKNVCRNEYCSTMFLGIKTNLISMCKVRAYNS